MYLKLKSLLYWSSSYSMKFKRKWMLLNGTPAITMRLSSFLIDLIPHYSAVQTTWTWFTSTEFHNFPVCCHKSLQHILFNLLRAPQYLLTLVCILTSSTLPYRRWNLIYHMKTHVETHIRIHITSLMLQRWDFVYPDGNICSAELCQDIE